MSELIQIPFHGGQVLLVKDGKEERIILKTLCDVFSLDTEGQRQRILRDPRLKTWAFKMKVQIPTDAQRREHWTIPRRKLAAFLYGLQPNMVANEDVRERLVPMQEELDEAMQSYFEARMGGVSREELLAAIERATAPLMQRLEQQNRMLSARRDGSQLIGPDRKQDLVALAEEIADMQVGINWKPDRLRGDTGKAWRVAFGELLADAADHVRVTSTRWDELTGEEAARVERRLHKARRRVLKHLRSMGARPRSRRRRGGGQGGFQF